MMTPTEHSVGEMYRMYAPAIDALLGKLVKNQNDTPVLGKNSYDTVCRAARKEGYMQALDDLRAHFMKKA